MSPRAGGRRPTTGSATRGPRRPPTTSSPPPAASPRWCPTATSPGTRATGPTTSRSIGIEHAGFTNVTRFPDAEYRGSAKLAALIADTFLITPDRTHVIGHYQVPDPNHPGEWGGVDHHTDPGRTWNWPLYMAYLRADARDTPQQVVDNADATGVRYDPAVWHVASAQPGRYGATYLAAAPHRSRQPGEVPAGGARPRPLRPRDALAVRSRLVPGRRRRRDDARLPHVRPSTSRAAAAASATSAAMTWPPAPPGGCR